jgi:MFS family permease
MFTNLSAAQKQTIRLLSIGTFLEYFDLFLYAHMAVLLNDLFFPPTDSNSQSLLVAFGFCSSFVFRPFGAWLLGYVGDKYGRKVTIVFTTLVTGITCFIMAFLPTYAQIGMWATWAILVCRMLQGFASMGEIVGAQLLLTETIPLPSKFPLVGLINVFADMGATFAIAISVLATSYKFNWRIAFMIGACIAVIGTVARKSLRESPEFADASKRLKRIFRSLRQDPNLVKETPFYNEPVKLKTVLAYFLIKCGGPTFLYLAFFYSVNILKTSFNYNSHQILIHNLLLSITQMFGWSILRTYLSSKIHPLKILIFVWMMSSIFVPFLPWLLKHIIAPWQLFIIQSCIVIFQPTDLPGLPIFFKNFPVYRRFSAASFWYAMSGAIVFTMTSFGLTYLIAHFGYWGLLFLMVPVLIGYGYGLHHFIKLEKAAGRYPKLQTWDIAS